MNEDFYRKIVLDACVEDYTGLWLIVAKLREATGGAIDAAGILDILLGLLRENRIEAGMATRGGGFEPWTLSPEEAVARIAAEWKQLGRDPDLGDIVWFNATEP
jgi:hypothetical protein